MVKLDESADDAAVRNREDPVAVGNRQFNQSRQDPSGKARNDCPRGDRATLVFYGPRSISHVKRRYRVPDEDRNAAAPKIVREGLCQTTGAPDQVSEAVAPGAAATGPLANARDEPGHGHLIGVRAELRLQKWTPERVKDRPSIPSGPLDDGGSCIEGLTIGTNQLHSTGNCEAAAVHETERREPQQVQGAVERVDATSVQDAHWSRRPLQRVSKSEPRHDRQRFDILWKDMVVVGLDCCAGNPYPPS